MTKTEAKIFDGSRLNRGWKYKSILRCRAWLPYEKKMVFAAELKFFGEIDFSYIKENTKQEGCNYILITEPEHELRIMLGTGKADANGTNIYEGDILDMGGNYKAVVMWSEDKACFACTYTNKRWKNKNIKQNYIKTVRIPLHRIAHKRMILGNVYENPELLTEAQ